MNQSKQMYLENGFRWTSHLEEFCNEYGGREIDYPHPFTGEMVNTRFCIPETVRVGRKYGQYETTVNHLGEEIAPVGECSNGNIELLLTESGRLIGFADYMLLSWSAEGEHDNCRASLARLLQGIKPESTGLID